MVLAAGCQAPSVADAPPGSTTTRATVTTLPEATTTTTSTTVPTTTTTTTATTTTTQPTRTTLVISGTGDVNLDPSFVRYRDYEDPWTGLEGAFIEDDLTVVNLECAPSDLGTAWDKPWTFRCDTDSFPAMAAAGVDIASLANNHAMDFGFDAMLDGMEILQTAGIEPVGTGADYDEAYRPVMVDVNGWTVAVIGSGGVNPETGSWHAQDDRPGMTHGDDTESISAAIAAAKDTADLVIVTAHWGENGGRVVRPFERQQAEGWIEAGADGVFGHHQHVLHPLEFYEGKPIAFGLGNFVWQAYGEGRSTAIARFTYEPDGGIEACLVPVWIERSGHPVLVADEEPTCAVDTTP